MGEARFVADRGGEFEFGGNLPVTVIPDVTDELAGCVENSTAREMIYHRQTGLSGTDAAYFRGRPRNNL